MVLQAEPRSGHTEHIDSRALTVERYFTRSGEDPCADVTWELRNAVIADEAGTAFFEQEDVEIPASWSQTATNVVVSKYFRGPLGSEQRERSEAAETRVA